MYTLKNNNTFIGIIHTQSLKKTQVTEKHTNKKTHESDKFNNI
jgi:hypothetical protein